MSMSKNDFRLADQSMSMTQTGILKQDPSKASLGYGHSKEKNPAAINAQTKFENFMKGQDVALSVLFNVIDTNSDKALSRSEFK
jgi:hypothetical protein